MKPVDLKRCLECGRLMVDSTYEADFVTGPWCDTCESLLCPKTKRDLTPVILTVTLVVLVILAMLAQP